MQEAAAECRNGGKTSKVCGARSKGSFEVCATARIIMDDTIGK